nr:hypothetical protein [Tanacetum cinerariifolium]
GARRISPRSVSIDTTQKSSSRVVRQLKTTSLETNSLPKTRSPKVSDRASTRSPVATEYIIKNTYPLAYFNVPIHITTSQHLLFIFTLTSLLFSLYVLEQQVLWVIYHLISILGVGFEFQMQTPKASIKSSSGSEGEGARRISPRSVSIDTTQKSSSRVVRQLKTTSLETNSLPKTRSPKVSDRASTRGPVATEPSHGMVFVPSLSADGMASP